MRRRAVKVRRLGIAVTAWLVPVLIVSGCSSPGEEPPGLTATPTPSVTPATVDDDDTEAEAAVLDVYDRFWAANVEAERGNPDPALYVGIADGPAVEVELAIARQYQESGIAKEGEPVISEPVVEIDGDEARVAACVDHTGWVPAGAPAPVPGVVATEVIVNRVGDDWVVSEYVEPTLELPC